MVDRSDWIEEEPLGSIPITFDQEEEEEWEEDDDWDDEDDEEEFEDEDDEEEETVTMTSVKEALRDPGKSQTCPQGPVIASRPRHDSRAAFFLPSTTGHL